MDAFGSKAKQANSPSHLQSPDRWKTLPGLRDPEQTHTALTSFRDRVPSDSVGSSLCQAFLEERSIKPETRLWNTQIVTRWVCEETHPSEHGDAGAKSSFFGDLT